MNSLYVFIFCILQVTKAWNILTYSANGTAFTPFSLVGGYDLNNDSIPDVIAGSIYQNAVYVFFHFSSSQIPDITINGPGAYSLFGTSVAVGDVNGDGKLDLFVGAPDEGKVYIYYGNITSASTSSPNTFVFGPANSNFGASIAIGNVNNDSYADLLVGAPNAHFDEGAVYVYLGSSTGLGSSSFWSQESNTVGASLGFSVALIDVDGNGFDDVLGGAPTQSSGSLVSAGAVYLYKNDGTSIATTPSFVQNTQTNKALFGYYIANLGKTDNDTIDDVAILSNDTDTGVVHFYKEDQGVLQSIGSLSGVVTVRSVAAVGDLDEDGYNEVIVAGNGSWAVLRGSPAGMILSGFAFTQKEDNIPYLGSAVTYAGDIDKDGYLDVLLGCGLNNTVLLYATAGESIIDLANATPSALPTASAVPTTTGTSDSKPKNNNTGVIVGAVVGGIVGLGIAIAVIAVVAKRRNRNREENPDSEVPMRESSQQPDVNSPQTNYVPLSSSKDSSSEDSNKWQRSESKDNKKPKDEVTQKVEAIIAQQWEISYKDIKLGSEIGRGGFGVVYKARWMNSDCVVKQLNISSSDKKAVDDFLKEANTVRYIKNHQNVCTIFGVCTNPEYPICIVMEYVPGGNLQTLIFDKTLKLDTSIILKIARDITGGMSYLHKMNVLHCDLACRNLLVAPDMNGILVKITDFGLARINHSEVYDASKKSVFPIRWSAPEVLTQLKLSSDVWSFGVVMWEVLEGKLPYYTMENSQVIEFVCQKKKILPKPTEISYPPQIYDIMVKCWSFDPNKRPSFEELCDTFTEMDDKKILNSNTAKEQNSEEVYESRSLADFKEQTPAVYGNEQK